MNNSPPFNLPRFRSILLTRKIQIINSVIVRRFKKSKNMVPIYAALLFFISSHIENGRFNDLEISLRSFSDRIFPWIARQIAALDTPARLAISAPDIPFLSIAIFIFTVGFNMLTVRISQSVRLVKYYLSQYGNGQFYAYN